MAAHEDGQKGGLGRGEKHNLTTADAVSTPNGGWLCPPVNSTDGVMHKQRSPSAPLGPQKEFRPRGRKQLRASPVISSVPGMACVQASDSSRCLMLDSAKSGGKARGARSPGPGQRKTGGRLRGRRSLRKRTKHAPDGAYAQSAAMYIYAAVALPVRAAATPSVSASASSASRLKQPPAASSPFLASSKTVRGGSFAASAAPRRRARRETSAVRVSAVLDGVGAAIELRSR